MPIRLDITDTHRADLVLDRPAKRNALDRAMLEELRSRVREIAARADVRVVVVSGAGGVFCAGADIGDWAEPPPGTAEELSRLGADTFEELASLPQPTVAVLEGPVLGGGLELALACDLRLAAETARLGLPEVRLGNLPSWGGLPRLVELVGPGVARELLLGGAPVAGTRAAALGLVSRAVPAAGLPAEVASAVDDLLAGSAEIQALAKRVLSGYHRALPTEAALAAHTATLPASRERKRRFLAERAARAAARSRPAGASALPFAERASDVSPEPSSDSAQ